MATVIDQLIVTLGLDAAGFKRGSDEATRQTKRTQDTLKKSSEAMTRSLKEVTRQVAVMFLGFETATGLISFLARLNQAQASLSRMSQNLGISARALDVWDKKIELAGGTVQGAQAAIAQLMQDATALTTLGQVSPLLTFFNRLGISAANTAFSGEQAKAAYEQLFEALRKLPRSTAFELATQAGVSPDVLQYGLRPSAEREALAREAERLSKTTDANAKAADDLRERWVAIQDSISAIGVTFLEKITPAIERMLPVVEKFSIAVADWIGTFDGGKTTEDPAKVEAFNKRIDERNAGIEDKRKTIAKVKTGAEAAVVLALFPGARAALLGNLGMELGKYLRTQAAKFYSWAPAPYAQAFQEATVKYHLPPGLLESIADRESGFDPNAVGKKGELGLMQLLPKYHPNAGKDPKADIEEAAATLAELYRKFGDDTGAVIAAYNAGETRIAKAIAGHATVPTSTQDYVSGVTAEMIAASRYPRASAPAAAAVSHNQFDITINTRATDGQQVAVDFMAEMQKRNMVWQSDTGLVP